MKKFSVVSFQLSVQGLLFLTSRLFFLAQEYDESPSRDHRNSYSCDYRHQYPINLILGLLAGDDSFP